MVTQTCGHVLHDAGDFAIETREPRATSRHRRKCFQLVLSLDIGQLFAKCSGVLIDEELFTDADGKNGRVGFPNPFHDLIEIHSAEGVYSGSQDQDGLLALGILYAVQNIRESIEEIRFAKWRIHHLVKSLHDLVAVVSEVHLNVGAHIEGFQCDPVIRLEIVQKGCGPIARIVRKELIS